MKCLVIMPSGDLDGYPEGHFKRVYDYVIAPACNAAGYMPMRVADSLLNSGDVTDLLTDMIESDVAICDLSATNQSVAYGFVIRHVLNLPVVLIKDLKTVSSTISNDFDLITYDESLRIDTVQSETSLLTAAINKAITDRPETHPLLKQFGQLQNLPDVEVTKPKEKSVPIISPLPDYVGPQFTEVEIEKLKVGDELFHLSRGRGVITSLKNSGSEKLAGIKFESGSSLLVISATDYFRKILN